MTKSNINCPICHGWFDVEIDNNEIKSAVKENSIKEKEKKHDEAESLYKSPPVKPLVEWSDKYNLGIKDIDEQHQQIVNIINRINESIKSGNRDSNLIENILNELNQFIKEHFSLEEQLFMGTNYPNKKMHQFKHKMFAKQVDDLYQMSKDSFVDLKPTLGFLVGWFLDHSQGTDREYLNYIDKDDIG